MHEHKTSLGYIEIAPYIYIGITKCCRPTFAQVEGTKADINFEGRLNKELLFAGASFISSLVKEKIKVYAAHENKNSKAISFVIAYLVLKGMNVNRAISLIKKKAKIEIEENDGKLLLNFEKTLNGKITKLVNKKNNKDET